MFGRDEKERETARDMHETSLLERNEYPLGSLMSFNAEFGYLEAFVRGLKSGFLNETEYGYLCNCEGLDEVRLALNDTDYKVYLQDLAGPDKNNLKNIKPIMGRVRKKFTTEFDFLRKQAVGSMSSFLEFITYEDLIENIQFIISSLIRGSDPESLIEKCESIGPLGKSPHLKHMLTFDNHPEKGDGLLELYRTVLVDTPVARYFEKFFNSELKADQSVSEVLRVYEDNEIELITDVLKKHLLEDFYRFSQSLGGETAFAMKVLLEFEADKRAIMTTYNSVVNGNDLNSDVNRSTKRNELYCTFGTLYPYSVSETGFQRVRDIDGLKQFLAPFKVYSELFRRATEPGSTVSLNDMMKEYQTHLCRMAFMGQSHLACFYAFSKLKTQEIANIDIILKGVVTSDPEKKTKLKNKWIKTF